MSLSTARPSTLILQHLADGVRHSQEGCGRQLWQLWWVWLHQRDELHGIVEEQHVVRCRPWSFVHSLVRRCCEEATCCSASPTLCFRFTPTTLVGFALYITWMRHSTSSKSAQSGPPFVVSHIAVSSPPRGHSRSELANGPTEIAVPTNSSDAFLSGARLKHEASSSFSVSASRLGIACSSS